MISIENVKFSYKDREALKGISLSIQRNEIFGLLGPNGSGKTTLFRILSTAFRPSSGQVTIHGFLMPGQEDKIREKTGVVFQSPSLDGKLSVLENLIHHGHLYGISGRALHERCDEMLGRLGMKDRAKERVDKLSGGLKRRVELAKALLHRPELVILDEPSTGLDPGARIDLWKYLKRLRGEEGVTVLVTTHLMDEADHCDRLAVMSHGQIVSCGKPEELKKKISGDVIVAHSENPEVLAKSIEEKLSLKAAVLDGTVQLEHEKGAEFVARLAGLFSSEITSITVRKPTLEDVFIHETGHRFWDEAKEAAHV